MLIEIEKSDKYKHLYTIELLDLCDILMCSLMVWV